MPEPHLGFWATKGNTCRGRTPVVLPRPTRCRILECVIRLLPVLPAKKTGGSRPWTRDWPHRIEPCSPNGRPCRTDSDGSSPALPMGVCEGHSPRRVVRFTQVSLSQAVSLPHGLNRGGGNRKRQGIPGVPFLTGFPGEAVTSFAVSSYCSRGCFPSPTVPSPLRRSC